MKIVKHTFWTAGIFVAGYFIFVISLSLYPNVNDYFNRKDFDSDKWKSWEETETDPSLRWNMIHDLKTKHELIGMTRLEIKNLLGEPGSETENEMRYYLGMSGHGINSGSLVIKIKEDKVIDYQAWQG